MFKKLLFSGITLMQGAIGYAADTRDAVQLAPFHYNTHAQEVLKLALANRDLMGPLPENSDERQKALRRHSEKLEVYLHNGYHMSPVKIVKNSMQRMVLFDGHVKGLMSFFQTADDKKGYIEELCTIPRNHTPYFKCMVDYALTQFKQKNIPTVLVHTGEHDTDGQAFFRTHNFVQLPQSEMDKKCGAIAFEYTDETVIGINIVCKKAYCDSFNIPIAPFNYDLHAEDTKLIIRNNIELLCPLPEDVEKRNSEIARLNAKIDPVLYNGYIMSQTKIVKDSMERVVLTNNAQVKGVMDFYIQAENNKGYIETLSTMPHDHLAHQKALIQYALTALQKKGVKQTQTHLLAKDSKGATPLKELGFVELPQGELEKSAGALEFEYTHPVDQQ